MAIFQTNSRVALMAKQIEKANVLEKDVMNSSVKHLTKRLFSAAGLELKKIEYSNSEEACATRLFRKTAPNLIIDVGANEGQFGERILQMMPQKRLLSFEPLSSAHRKLSDAAKKYPQWLVAERCAIGDMDGTIEINISNNSVSSSILPMEAAHRNAAPDSAYVNKEQVPIKRLDSVLPGYIQKGDRAYLKVDTQGYEKNVLLGAKGIMANLCAIQLELSLVELYAGQALAFDMIEFMRALGFHLFALSNGFSDPESGEMLQVDAFFIAATTQLGK